MNKAAQTPGEHDVTCDVCGKQFRRRDVQPWIAVRPSVSALIGADKPGWADGKFICKPDLGTYRRRHVENLLRAEGSELSALDQEVIDSLSSGQLITDLPDADGPDNASFGERAADAVARFGGSWTFILAFTAFLVAWMALNITAWWFRPFDPYPFILLNLALSSLAALQAPIIMMSQRRQETKDRQRAENDYKVNLKAELEIRQLHEKLDHQLARQWERLAELQQIQIELLEDRSEEGK